MSCLTGISSDIYAPSISTIAADLQSSIDDVQWSMAIFMLGVSISQLIYGPLSDGVGRRFPLIIGLGISIIGSIICYRAPTMTILILGRFIQGIGAGAGASLWRTIFRDCFSGAELAKYGGYLSILIVLSFLGTDFRRIFTRIFQLASKLSFSNPLFYGSIDTHNYILKINKYTSS